MSRLDKQNRASILRQAQDRQAQHERDLPFPFAPVSSTGQALSLSKGKSTLSNALLRQAPWERVGVRGSLHRSCPVPRVCQSYAMPAPYPDTGVSAGRGPGRGRIILIQSNGNELLQALMSTNRLPYAFGSSGTSQGIFCQRRTWLAAHYSSLRRKACPVLDTGQESRGAARMDSHFRGNCKCQVIR